MVVYLAMVSGISEGLDWVHASVFVVSDVVHMLVSYFHYLKVGNSSDFLVTGHGTLGALTRKDVS